MKYKKTMIYAIINVGWLLMLYFTPLTSFALMTGFPFPGPDCKTPVGDRYTNEWGACTDVFATSKWSVKGLSYYSAGQELNSTGNRALIEGVLDDVFAPFTGDYFIRMHYCQVAKGKLEGERCTLGQSYMFVDSLKTIEVSSKKAIGFTSYDFGGGVGNGLLPYPSSMCFTLVDDKGVEWGARETLSTCVDANPLPITPAVCYINYGNELNVDFGTIERDKISLNPKPGDRGNIQKKTNVLCTRDAGVTVKTNFSFTPVNVNGNQVVSTTSDNIGVAIIYNGKVVTPTDVFTESYTVGYTDINLEFEMIRQATKSLGEIPTGEFTANAIMIMNLQ